MEINITEHESLYDQYKELIMQRDHIRKEGFLYREEYYRLFGDLLSESMNLKIQCIELKKRITFCQKYVNHGKKIMKEELDQYIEILMKDYQKELNQLCQDVKNSKDVSYLSDEEIKKIKRIYRKIAKSIHPDLHPELFEKPEVQDLWDRTMVAYTCNDLEELSHLEVLVGSYAGESGSEIQEEDLSQRMKHLKKEIQDLTSCYPYLYQLIIKNEESIKEHKEELLETIENEKVYQNRLQEIYDSFDIVSLVC